MDKGDVAAWVAALIAIGAALIALHNANSARTQATAATKQASDAEKARIAAEAQVELTKEGVAQARRSADAAELQAESARQQSAIMLEQLMEQRTDRDFRSREADRQAVALVIKTGMRWVDSMEPMILLLASGLDGPNDPSRKIRARFAETTEAYWSALVDAKINLVDPDLRRLMELLSTVFSRWGQVADTLNESSRNGTGEAAPEDVAAAMVERNMNRDFIHAVQGVVSKLPTTPSASDQPEQPSVAAAGEN